MNINRARLYGLGGQQAWAAASRMETTTELVHESGPGKANQAGGKGEQEAPSNRTGAVIAILETKTRKAVVVMFEKGCQDKKWRDSGKSENERG